MVSKRRTRPSAGARACTLKAVIERPLLAELHAHTTWSDGELALGALVDLYGRCGFDVLCVTDHVTRRADGSVTERVWPQYLEAIEGEADRALLEYGMLVLPGVELTDEGDHPLRSAHALAIGLTSFVSLDHGLSAAVLEARRAGAAIIAAHPHAPAENHRGTCRWWHERDTPSIRPDRYELFNRNDVFGWVAERRLPCVASGDFHRREHLDTWKTLLPCAKDGRGVVAFLRSPARAYLAPFPLGVGALAA